MFKGFFMELILEIFVGIGGCVGKFGALVVLGLGIFWGNRFFE